MPTPLNPTETQLGHALPSRRDEAWKWTDVRAAVSETASGLTSAMKPLVRASSGIAVTRNKSGDLDTAMGKLAQSFTPDVIMIFVPAGTSKATVALEDLTHGHARISIHISKNTHLNLTEGHMGQAGGFANIDLEIELAEGASITRTIVHNDPDDCTRVMTARVSMDEGAKFKQFTLSFGGALARLETRLSGDEENISALINGAYLLSDKRHCDMTSHIELSHPGAHIRQAVKGVVTDKARGVFQGKFLVQRAAQHTDAEMRHDALMLSDTAEIRSKPELEIYADDVACAHGNTIGQLDESALFYMQQRGIPAAQARAMLTQAFVADVFDDMEDGATKDGMLDAISTWLGA